MLISGYMILAQQWPDKVEQKLIWDVSICHEKCQTFCHLLQNRYRYIYIYSHVYTHTHYILRNCIINISALHSKHFTY